MNEITRTNLNNLWSTDRQLQNEAFFTILNLTDSSVDWAYEVWDELLENLNNKDNHNRAIAAQVLCNLARSDPNGRMLKDFKALLAVTKDERFVTARHCMQSLWKVGVAGEQLRLDSHAGEDAMLSGMGFERIGAGDRLGCGVGQHLRHQRLSSSSSCNA